MTRKNTSKAWLVRIVIAPAIALGIAWMPSPALGQAGATVHQIESSGNIRSISAHPNADGGFLVIWGQGTSIRGRKVAPEGNPVGASFEIRQDLDLYGYNPSGARLPDESFVVVWSSIDEYSYLANHEIMARKLDSTGTPVGDEFNVVESGGRTVYSPNVVTTQAGGFVVDWTSGRYTLYSGLEPWRKTVRAFDAAGNPLTSDLQVTGPTTLSIRDSRVAEDQNGGFIVSWSHDAGTTLTPRARRLDETGLPVGQELELASFEPTEATPSLSSLSGGGYRAVWPDPTPGSGGVRFGYADMDLELVEPGVVIESEVGEADDARIIVDAEGRPIVSWTERTDVAPFREAYFRYLNSMDLPTSASQQVTTGADDAAYLPTFALSGDRGVMVWRQSGLYLRTFSVPLFLDGFESGDTGGWTVVVP